MTLFDRFDNLALWGEKKFGRLGWTAILSFILLVLACIYVRPGTNYIGHGVNFEELSRHPFGPYDITTVGYRIMTPLIAFLLGLRGKPFIILNLVFAAINIGLIYYWFRSRLDRPGDALLAALTITFSCVILVTIFYAGFCDALTYLSIFLLWWFRSRPVYFYPIFMIGVLNHESVLFLIPGFIFFKLVESDKRWKTLLELVIGFGLVLSFYGWFRGWIDSRVRIELGYKYYLKPLLDDPLVWVKRAFTHWPIGWFSVFKLLWIFPMAAAVSLWQRGDRNTVIGMLLFFGGAAAQLIIAYDTTRMLTLSYLVMIIALEHLLRTNAFEFRRWAPWIFLFNLLIPQLYTAAQIIEIMKSTPMNLLQMILHGTPWWP